MAGRGPAPKPADKRARRNADPIPLRTYVATPTEQPELPADARFIRFEGDQIVVEGWPEQTLDWWVMWAESPMSRDFTSTDWSFLLDTARLHAEFWRGDTKVAAELRQRVAKFGATPEDRARLRITFAAAEEADGGDPKPAPRTAQSMYRGLRSVGGTDALAGS